MTKPISPLVHPCVAGLHGLGSKQTVTVEVQP